MKSGPSNSSKCVPLPSSIHWKEIFEKFAIANRNHPSSPAIQVRFQYLSRDVATSECHSQNCLKGPLPRSKAEIDGIKLCTYTASQVLQIDFCKSGSMKLNPPSPSIIASSISVAPANQKKAITNWGFLRAEVKIQRNFLHWMLVSVSSIFLFVLLVA